MFNFTSSNTKYLGKLSTSWYFGGKLDNVMVFNRALSDAEAKALYEAADTHASEAQMAHDKNGNLTRNREGVTMEYDALNRLKEVTSVDSETIAKYVYDADNRRMEKIVENGGLPDDSSLNGTTHYYYHGWRVVEERNGSGNIQRQYTYGNYLDEVWTIDDRSGSISVADLNDGSGSDRHFAHANTLYHVYGLTDEDGNLVEAYQYNAYGKTTVFTSKGADSTWFTSDDVTANRSAVNNPHQYTGQRYDPETGLYYYKNRYYNTDLGRFISRDFIGYEDSLNLYEYVLSQPTSYLDPSGNAVQAAPIVAAGLAAAAKIFAVSVAVCLTIPECRELAIELGKQGMNNLEENVKCMARKVAGKSRQYYRDIARNLRNKRNKDPKCRWDKFWRLLPFTGLGLIDNEKEAVKECFRDREPQPQTTDPQICPASKPKPKEPRPRTFPSDPPYDPRRPCIPHKNLPYS